MRIAVLVWSSWLLAVPALAQEDAEPAEGQDSAGAMDMAAEHMQDERARRHFEAGRNLYDAGAFDRAAVEFQEAYELSGRPELLYNIYVASRDAGDVRKATSSLEQYLREMGTSAPDRVNLEARLQALQEQVAAMDAAEADAQRRREEEAARQREADERERARREREQAEPSIVPPLVVAGIGAAALLGGVVTGVLALGAVSDIEDNCNGGDICPPTYAELDADLDGARTLVRLTDYLLLGGTIVLAGGLTWLFLTRGGGEHEPAVTAGCGPEGCLAGVRGAF